MTHATSLLLSLPLLSLVTAGGGRPGCTDPEGPPLPATLEVVATFDPAKGELPEGLTITDGVPAVGFAVLGQVRSVPATGAATTVATSPELPANAAFITGLGTDREGRTYMALPSFAESPAAGVYRTAPGGGAATRFTTGVTMQFPSDLAWDAQGNLYITDSQAGAIFKAAPSGETTVWLADPRLTGGREACAGDGLFDIGVNGLALTRDSLTVVNTDRGTLIEIPIRPDGSAGAPRVRIESCEALAGADGLTRDVDGSLYVALNRKNQIARITADDTITPIYEGGELDFPASVRIATVDGVRYLYLTNFALSNALAGKPAKPSLARLRLSR